ncbi:hypothetical protein Pint_11295 [Pistacia integerrima]|uniref:Uncharacterized protein n=1 Tax=Pistacia integerrima TaxID=434235 RepID=A0ACC0XHY5_9ROSI|nr:hypothetical protein Pint_11295 [Pistacia integerrima]
MPQLSLLSLISCQRMAFIGKLWLIPWFLLCLIFLFLLCSRLMPQVLALVQYLCKIIILLLSIVVNCQRPCKRNQHTFGRCLPLHQPWQNGINIC